MHASALFSRLMALAGGSNDLQTVVSSPAIATPKLLICSDSTTANYTSGPLQGWGYYIGDYLNIPVLNLAKNGRSTRTFIREGLWSQLLAKVSPGDFVVVEMGHNDAGDPRDNQRGARGVLRGVGEDTIVVDIPGDRPEVVHTFGWYLRQMISDVQKKQAIPLISGMVPTYNTDSKGIKSDFPFTRDAQTVAKQEKVEFVDHTWFTLKRWNIMESGENTKGSVSKFFPQDHTHTNPAGALVNAETFVTAVVCDKGKLTKFINGKGQAIKRTC